MPDSNHNVSAHDSACCMPKRNTAHANGYFQTQPTESVAQFQARMTNMQNQCAPFQASDVKKLQESQSIPYSWSGGHTFARTQNISQKYASKYPPAKSRMNPNTSPKSQSSENTTTENTAFIIEGLVKDSGLVLEIQDRLLELSYLEYGGVDGTYSEKPPKEKIGKTAAAIQQFQKDHGIAPTGKVDKLTLTALYQIVPETPLGMLSGAFESPTEGLAAIGWDARGGTSYGRFQLSSKNEVVTKFVKSLEAKKDDPQAQQIAQALKDSQFPTNREDKNGPKGTVLNTYDKGSYAKTGKGTPMEVWRQYARQLKPYVEGFVIDKYYTTPINKAKMNFSRNKDLWNMIENSRTLQEVFMSTAIQHGQYEVGNFWNRIYNSLGNKEKNPDTLIKEIYAVRKADYSQHAKRYEKEEKLASDMREYEAD